MKGKEIIKAMSYVDEAYIEEAESGKLRKQRPVQYLLPMAACLGIILLGLRFAPGIPKETLSETIGFPQETVLVVSGDDHAVKGGLAVVPDAQQALTLQIEEWSDEGFTAVVVATEDAEQFPVGRQLRVILTSDIVVERIEDELVHAQRRMPTEAQFPPGSRVRVRFASYSVEDHTLLIDSIIKEGE